MRKRYVCAELGRIIHAMTVFKQSRTAPIRTRLGLALSLAIGSLFAPAWAQTPPADAPSEVQAAAEEQAEASAKAAAEAAQAAADAARAAADAADAAKAKAEAAREDAFEATLSRIPLDEIRRYVAVFNAVRSAYVEPVSDKDLMQAAIKGLLLDLDPHSVYFEKDDAQSFAEGAAGAYGGVGVEVVNQPDGSLRVVAPLDDSPAARAGLRTGDVITHVDGQALQPGASGPSPLRGEAGTTARVTVLREGETAPLELRMQRETIRVTSVRSRLLEPGFGYVRISQFQADTAADFGKAITELSGQSPAGLKGVVLDLRSNPGGLLTSAVKIADDLLESGQIVSTRGRIPISDAQFSATAGDILHGAPVVVLMDAGSASASEVLAGALRDNNRARIIGSRSFGKGSVQTLLPLDNGDSIKLTTARYYTPNGTSIQARGIEPDVLLKADGSTQTGVPRVSEASLPGHLQGDNEDGNSGESLPGQAPIDAALRELKTMVQPR